MPRLHESQHTGGRIPPARLDIELHQILKEQSPRCPPPTAVSPRAHALTEPVFPQHPELLAENHPLDRQIDSRTRGRHWTAPPILHYRNGWLFPYVKSRVLAGDFHPIIAYRFTEWKCNLDCHY